MDKLVDCEHTLTSDGPHTDSIHAVSTHADIADSISAQHSDTIRGHTTYAEDDDDDDDDFDDDFFDDDDDADDDADYQYEDSLTFSNGVIEKIVAIAVRDVPGVAGMKGGWFSRVQDAFGASAVTKGVSVEATDADSVYVNISIMIEYGAYAPQIFEDIKREVVKQIDAMTGLEVSGINLRVEDVLSPDEYEQYGHRPLEAIADAMKSKTVTEQSGSVTSQQHTAKALNAAQSSNMNYGTQSVSETIPQPTPIRPVQ